MAVSVNSVDKRKLHHFFEDGNTIHYFEMKNGEIRKQIWSRGERVGKGGFGQVWPEVIKNWETFKNELPENRKFRAVKEIPRAKMSSRLIARELEAIVKFSEPKYRDLFVESYGWFDTQSTVFIAMEYLEKGSLQNYLKKPLPPLAAKQISVQILEGLCHMHGLKFTHRDLKPENLLVVTTRPWHVKIADFGLCKQVVGDSTALRTNNGTDIWRAPEYLLFGEHPDWEVKLTEAVDIWSFGAIVYNMLIGKRPFPSPLDISAYRDGRNNLLEEDFDSDKFGIECVDFLKRTMAPKPEHRMEAYDCLRHPWLKAYREGSFSLEPVGTIGSSSTSRNPPENFTQFSRSNKSGVRSNINESLPSANWDSLDRTKTKELTELPIRDTMNGVFKPYTSPSSPASYYGTIARDTDRTELPIRDTMNGVFTPYTSPSNPGSYYGTIARDTDRKALPPKGSNFPVSRADISRVRHAESPSYNPSTSIAPPRSDFISSETRSSFRESAAVLYHKGQWDDLVNQMHDMIEVIGPTDPAYSEFLGIMGLALLFCSGQEKRAEVILRRAKEFSKETRHTGLNYLLARACFRQNKHDQGDAQLRQALRDLLQEPDADQELIFEEGYQLGVILLGDSRTKSEGRELLNYVKEECYSKLPQHAVGLKASAALNSHRG